MYNGKFVSIIDVPTDDTTKNLFAAKLIAHANHYTEVLNIIQMFDLEIFKQFTSPHFKSISFNDTDEFKIFDRVLNYLQTTPGIPEFVISDKETDSKQTYFVMLIKGI